MKFTAGTSPQASGGVSSDEQDRRPEACAGRLPRKHITGTKAVNRRNLFARGYLLGLLYPVWLLVVIPLFGALIIAEWLGKHSYKRNRWV